MKYWFIGVLLFGTACSSEKKEEVKQTAKAENDGIHLLGSWKNLTMIIRMPDSTLNVPEDKWEEVLGIKPIITTFSDDGSYVSEYRTLEDSIFMTRAGSWKVENDSLIMVDGDSPVKYHYEVFKDTVIFTGFVDWDQDGTKDDHYAGKQVRISKEN